MFIKYTFIGSEGIIRSDVSVSALTMVIGYNISPTRLSPVQQSVFDTGIVYKIFIGPEGIIRPVISVSVLIWIIGYICTFS